MSSAINITLKVPFNEKDQAKALGARWNVESKHWYVPQGIDARPFEKWFSNSPTPSVSAKTTPPSAKPLDNLSSHSIEGDMDAINAQLRDAYEMRDSNEF
jgi:hypothetical protein